MLDSVRAVVSMLADVAVHRADHRRDGGAEVGDHLLDAGGARALRLLLGLLACRHAAPLDLAGAEHFERARHVADLVAVVGGR